MKKSKQMKHKVYTLLENADDGTFCFEGETNRLSWDLVRRIHLLQPDATWILICEVETYKRLAKEREGKSKETFN